MSINWPIKSEDIDEVINNLEKELTKKEIEIKQKNRLISELTSSLEEHKIKSREVKAKIEYVNEEITKLENNLEKSKLKLAFIDKEVEDIKKNIVSKEQENFKFNLKNKKLRERVNQLDSYIKKLRFLNLNNVLKEIKETLSIKGFLVEEEFEELIKNIDVKE
jgi:chromosome segregation ATPase